MKVIEDQQDAICHSGPGESGNGSGAQVEQQTFTALSEPGVIKTAIFRQALVFY